MLRDVQGDGVNLYLCGGLYCCSVKSLKAPDEIMKLL